MTIDTERLLLRKPEPEDFSGYWAMKNDVEATRFTGGITPYSYNERLELFKKEWVDADQHTEFSVIVKADNAYIGYCGLVDNGESGCELMYGIERSAWGKGYGYEAVAAMVRYGLLTLGCSQIVAAVDSRNVASERILQKVGMLFNYAGEEGGVLLRRYKLHAADYSVARQ